MAVCVLFIVFYVAVSLLFTVQSVHTWQFASCLLVFNVAISLLFSLYILYMAICLLSVSVLSGCLTPVQSVSKYVAVASCLLVFYVVDSFLFGL